MHRMEAPYREFKIYHAVQERMRRLRLEEGCMKWIVCREKCTSVPRARSRGKWSTKHKTFCVVNVLSSGKFLPTFKTIVMPSHQGQAELEGAKT